MKERTSQWSLNSRRLGIRLISAFALMSILPLLIFAQHLFSSSSSVPSPLLLMAILFSLLGFSLMASILKPLSKVVGGAKALADGTFIPQFEMERKDEIGELEGALNKVGGRLRQSIDNLKIHEERTENLNREMKELLKQIENLAITDDITGLYNKKYLRERLNKEIERGIAEQRPCSFVLFYINHFKSYNDACGETAGDSILREVAQLILTNIRDVDKAIRIGGGRFVVILPERNKKEALEFSTGVKKRVEGHSFPHQERLPGGSLTVSSGVASTPIDGTTSEELLERAVAALAREEEGKERTGGADG